MSDDRITGMVLAGGQGSRMGGADKGWIEWHGRPLIGHAIDRLSPQVDRVMVSANRHLDRYRSLGHPVVTDRRDGFAGPLAGIQAGLAACTTPLLAVVPCDAPLIPADLVSRLRTALGERDSVAVASVAGRLQPTFLLCRRDIAPQLDAWLAAGRFKVGAWLHELGAIAVPFSDGGAFANLNTPEDLR